MKIFLEWGPLVAFFVAFKIAGIMTATAVLMGATTIAVAAEYIMHKRLAPMPLITLALVLLFGGLSLYLHDERFIKMKPTLLFGGFAAVLFFGVLRGKGWVALMFGKAMELPDSAWRILSIRFAVFFAVMAVLNEFIWRVLTTEQWVLFKTIGALPLTVLFVLAQVPFIKRNGGM
jgi:intracellular septation protein